MRVDENDSVWCVGGCGCVCVRKCVLLCSSAHAHKCVCECVRVCVRVCVCVWSGILSEPIQIFVPIQYLTDDISGSLSTRLGSH